MSSTKIGDMLVQLTGAVFAGGFVCAIVHFAFVGTDVAIQSTMAVMLGGLTAGIVSNAIEQRQKRMKRDSANQTSE
jgi:hypothetical protein